MGAGGCYADDSDANGHESDGDDDGYNADNSYDDSCYDHDADGCYGDNGDDDSCYGLNCVPSKFMCGILTPSTLE